MQDFAKCRSVETGEIDVRAPIISEVIAENPGLTEEQLIQMMDEMGF